MPVKHTNIETFADYDRLIDAAADALAEAVNAAIEARGYCLLGLTGGDTPKDLYLRLATEPYVSAINWSQVHFFWGDERCVPPVDARSNYRMAHETLLTALSVPASNMHRMRGEENPATAAEAYERELRERFKTPEGPPTTEAGRRFDLILMGMGDDGHTASLFPGHRAVHERSHWVVAEYIDKVDMWRITLTPPVINAAAEILYLVAGDHKAQALQRVHEGPDDPDQLPTQAIARRMARL